MALGTNTCFSFPNLCNNLTYLGSIYWFYTRYFSKLRGNDSSLLLMKTFGSMHTVHNCQPFWFPSEHCQKFVKQWMEYFVLKSTVHFSSWIIWFYELAMLKQRLYSAPHKLVDINMYDCWSSKYCYAKKTTPSIHIEFNGIENALVLEWCVLTVPSNKK